MRERPSREDARLAFVLLRHATGLDQARFAALARISRSQVSVYERGDRAVPWQALERASDAAGLPRILIAPLLRVLRSFRAATAGWSKTSSVASHRLFSGLLEIGGQTLEILEMQASGARSKHGVPSPEDRQVAEQLWLRLRSRPHSQRLVVVEEAEEFHSWALSERVAEESIAVAPDSPALSLELAEFALHIAELCPGEHWLRSLVRGYAWFHISNARRVRNDLPGAEAALHTAKELWGAGPPWGPELFLNASTVLGLEATLHRVFGRFDLAIRRIDEALSLPGATAVREKLLLSKAQILEAAGESDASTELLMSAVQAIDDRTDARTDLGIRFHLLVNLCLEDRAPEARAGLPAVRALAENLGREMDLVRVAWLSGKVAAGCGSLEEAENAFREAREKFADNDPPLVFNYALVTLDLALLLLGQGRTEEVRSIAEQMTWIFSSQGVAPEALAALRVFCKSAKAETATREMALRIVRFLHRAQYNATSRFS